jgi:Mg2+/Co2+ transporter CorB
MVHRKQIDTIDIDQPIEVVLQEILTSSHTRLPLWQEDPDNIIGVLNVKSLVRHMKDSNWQIDRDTLLSLCSTPWFIPETTTLKDQLLAFRQKRQHFAIVVDEYGSLLGIVTLEDIIEEIVGEIDDEMDEEEVQEISAVEEGVWQLEGSLSIRTLNRHLDTRFPEDSASTVAGLFLQEFREIPELGDAFERDSYRFTVLEKEGNRITRLRMERVTESENGES